MKINLETAQKKIKELSSKFFQKNKYEKVIEEYIALANKHPEDMRVRIKIAELYFKTREIDKAIITYREIADVYLKQNFVLKTVAMLKNILRLDPTLHDVNLELAELFVKLDMKTEAVNQYHIAMQALADRGENEMLILICQKLVKLDPSTYNRRKLAELYQSHGMHNEAVEQYETLAKMFRQTKEYDSLLHTLELILPHKADNKSTIRDIAILYLRRKDPDNAIRIMERNKVDTAHEFKDLFEKAKLLKKMLRAPKVAPKKTA